MTSLTTSPLEKAFRSAAANPVIVALVVLFAAFSVVARLFNHEIFWLINRNFPMWLDVTMFYMSNLGDGVIAVTLSLWLFLGNSRKGFIGLMSLIIVMLMVQSLKRYFDMPRPAAVFESLKVLGPVLHQHSFPSGHSATVWAMVTLLLLDKNVNRIALLGLGIAGSLARVYVGAHFPFDVAVGALVGILSVVLGTMLVNLFNISWDWFERFTVRFAILGLIFFFGIYVTFFHMRHDSFGFFIFTGGMSLLGVLLVFFSMLRSRVISKVTTPILR
ncbi:MAG TPA: phosphatase PAP2 family protein [Williamwhitmania sp.]|jgi:membrane-associated phospholipid phosphatase|nr:phosphatase PAP2 family protein [Williamwhitmania sp.]